jgi:hypothetical protein
VGTKQKKKILKLTLLMLCFSTLIVHGQNKLQIYQTGTYWPDSFNLTEIRKLTFREPWSSSESWSLLVHDSPTGARLFNIEKINYINFYIDANSIEENEKDNNLCIYPNPVTNKLTVKYNEIIDDLKIFDMLGKIFLSLSPKIEIIDIEMSQFPAGMYFLRIISNNKVSIGKIVKTNNH